MALISGGRQIHLCPLCGGELERVHRHLGDRLLAAFRSVHRYQCVNGSCTWEGIVSDDLPDEGGGDGRPRLTWRARVLWFLIGAAVAVASVQVVRMTMRDQAVKKARLAKVTAQRQALPPLPVDVGESYDGEALAEDDLRKGDHASPLTLRRGCAWGVPGRTPYVGTVAQALTTARVPESAVRKFEAMVEKKLISDRVEITRDGITTVSKRRQFDSLSFNMAFGKTMCFNTRVNFKPGHVELADLYEATDAEGRRYTVMVPDVCGNVSVLGDREERNGPPPDTPTPEPATLALFAGALAALAWFTRQRSRRGRAAAQVSPGENTPPR